MMEQDAFITSLPAASYKIKKRSNNDKLENVRKDHAQLMDIVKKFGSKVSTMVDNQRMDYMVAYENHMLDVQKELYLLREKVQEIATDSTRDEKIKSLEAAQTKYKSESILLDQQNNEMRKKLRSLTVSMQAAERDRDWLLSRLRKAKKIYSTLESEYGIEKLKCMAEDSTYSNSLDLSISQESSLLLGLYKSKEKEEDGSHGSNKLTPINRTGAMSPKPAWKSRLAATVYVNRSDPFKEPFGETNGLQNGRRNGQRGTGGYGVGTESEGGSPIVTVNIQNELNMYKNKRNQLEKNRREKNIISSLVTLRERKKGMRETVERCLRVCERGDTGDQQNGTSSLSELVFVCLESIEENRTEVEQRRTRTQNLKVQSDDSASNNGSDAGSTNQSSGNDHSKRSGTPDIGKERGLESDEREREHRAWLSSQLMAHPETFLAILDILAGKYLGSTSLSQSDPVIDIDEVEAANNSIINGLANFDTTSWLNASNRDTRSCMDVGRGSLLKKEKNVRKLSGSMNRKPSTSSIFTKRGDNVKSPREPIAEIRSAAVFMNLPVDQRGGGWGSQAVCISSEKTEGNDPFNDSIAGSLCDDRSEDGLANAVNDDGEQGE